MAHWHNMQCPGVLPLVLVLYALGSTQAESQRNIWERQYAERTAESLAAQFESPSRPVFRHRHDIVALLQLQPGMTVAEIGAGSGFLSRLAAQQLASGRVIATELDDKMIDYMNQRAAKEGIRNFMAIKNTIESAGLEPDSVDAVLIVNTYSFFDRPREMLRSIHQAMRRDAVLVLVDFPREGPAGGAGVDPSDVIRAATESGFTLIDNSPAIPGHYALRFRRTH